MFRALSRLFRGLSVSCQDYEAAFGAAEFFGDEEIQEPQECEEVEKKFNPNDLQPTRTEVDHKFYPICSISNSPQQDFQQEVLPPPPASEQPLSKEITKEVTMFQISKDPPNQCHVNKRTGSTLSNANSSYNYSAPDNSLVGNLRAVEDLNTSANEVMDRPLDQDLAFFFSILPTVRKFDEDMKLEFRVEVIKTIQKMKLQQKNKE